MKDFKKYIQKKKYIFLFLGSLLLFGSIIGLVLSMKNMDILESHVIFYQSHLDTVSYNYLLFHFFLLVISIATSFFGVGILLLCAIVFYEGITIGFVIGAFTEVFDLSGALFSLIFCLITKGIYLCLLTLIFIKCIQIARKMIGFYIYKKDQKKTVIQLLKSSIICFILIFINDFLLLILGTKIISLFHFLIS